MRVGTTGWYLGLASPCGRPSRPRRCWRSDANRSGWQSLMPSETSCVRAIPVPSISRVAEAITAANRRATVIAVGIGLACASGMLTLALGAKALLLLLTPLVLAFAALVLLLYPERSFEIFLVMLPMYLMSL